MDLLSDSDLETIDYPFADREISSNLPTTISIDSSQSSTLLPIDFDPFIDGEILLTAPATESQQEIWVGVQMDRAANLACILSQSLRLVGLLDLDLFQLAIGSLAMRHEALRTTFNSDGTMLLIAKEIKVEFPIIDLSELTSEAQAIEIDRHHQQATSEVFDLRHGPLFSTKILKLNDREHLVIFTIHHIICDGWSLGILISDLAKIYTALHQGSSPQLDPPESLSEYAFLEQVKTGSVETIATEAYWLKKFASLPPVVDLPADYPRPLLRTFNSACENYTLPASLVREIKHLGAKQGASLMTTLLAAFEIFLFKITGQPESIVGVPISGQSAAGKYNLVGHCVNFLPLRSKIDAQSNFTEYLKFRNSEILDDYDRQDFTFGSLLKKLAIPRDASRIPLISAAFNMDVNSGDESRFDGLAVEAMMNHGEFATFEFFLNAVTVADGRIDLDCQYNTNLFRAATIHRRLSEFENLLTQITQATAKPISNLSLLSAIDRHQLLVAWNHTHTDYPRHQSIHQLFEAQVERDGDAIALVFEQHQLTYRELNHRANQLAHYLIGLGVQPEEPIGIGVDRSIETIVGILGILKAGGAYLPLDLAYPPARLSLMLENAKVSILLTKTTLIDRLPSHHAKVLDIDTSWDEIAKSSSTNPPQLVDSTNLAYVMYTSGSTGQPKGVCVPHHSVVRLVKATNYVDFDSHQVFLQLASIAFDAATFEIWGSLLNGGKLILFPGDKPSLAELGQIIHKHQITTLFLTTGLFNLMVDERIEDLKPLRQLLTGGDVTSVTHVRKALSTLVNCQLINVYGPTENTTFTSYYPISPADELVTPIPIGRPISNTQIYLLDSQLQPVPIGIAGELYIGGDGLARGYLAHPDANLEKFIPNLLTGSGQLYQTGDLARYLPDGNIQFLGRRDNQVKVRGFRAELGEIEAAIARHPNVRQVCAIAREDRPGDKRLVAYIVTQPGLIDTPEQNCLSDIRAFLKSRLPDYLLPSAIVTIETLPLTPNGKVDRQALPIPDYVSPDASADRQAATTLTAQNEWELQLVKIWERLLDVHPIGVSDNFFELGGHSLIAVRLFAEIERIWGQNLPLATLFQAQTIEELAAILRQTEWVAPWSSLVAIQPHGSKPPLFCFHPIGGNILEYYPLADYLGADRPIYGLQSQGLDGKQLLLSSVEEMAAQYIKDLLTIQPQEPYLLVGYSFGGLIVYEVAQQLHALGKQVDLLAIIDCNSPNFQTVRPSFAKSLQIHLGNIWQISVPEKIQYIKDRIDYRLNNVDYREFLIRSFPKNAPPSPELLQLIDANFAANQAYVARPYPGNLTLFRCRMQTLEYHLSPDLGWGDLVTGNLEIHNIASSHYSILREPVVRIVAEKIQACLEETPISIREGGDCVYSHE
jgi:amino acid adenylation domain-containing protein